MISVKITKEVRDQMDDVRQLEVQQMKVAVTDYMDRQVRRLKEDCVHKTIFINQKV